MNKIVGLGGVFNKNRTNSFYDFVFPYVNEVDLEDGDDYFTTLVITNKGVNVRQKPDVNSRLVGTTYLPYSNLRLRKKHERMVLYSNWRQEDFWIYKI
jgi:hypothetical protein